MHLVGEAVQLVCGTVVGDLVLVETAHGIPATLATRVEALVAQQLLDGHQVIVAADSALRTPVLAIGGVGPALIPAVRVRGVGLYSGEYAQRQLGATLPSGIGDGFEWFQVQLLHGQQTVPDRRCEGTVRKIPVVVADSLQLAQVGYAAGQGQGTQCMIGVASPLAQPHQHPFALRRAQMAAERLVIRIVDTRGPDGFLLVGRRPAGREEGIRQVTCTGDDGTLPSRSAPLLQNAQRHDLKPATNGEHHVQLLGIPHSGAQRAQVLAGDQTPAVDRRVVEHPRPDARSGRGPGV